MPVEDPDGRSRMRVRIPPPPPRGVLRTRHLVFSKLHERRTSDRVRIRADVSRPKNRRLAVPPPREEDIDDLAELVDGSEQVAPGASDLYVGLIDVPAVPNHVPAGPSCFDELGG